MAYVRVVARNGRSALGIGTIALLLLPLFSCATPEAVAKFCSSAVATMKSGDALFDDMKASCVREVQTREPFGKFVIADVAVPPECENVGAKAEGLKAASKVLLDYFAAINDLASFGSRKPGDDVKDLVSKVSRGSTLSAARQTAFASIGALVTRMATAGYQQKHLKNDIVVAHNDIAEALAGLGEAVGVIYLQQLQEEAKKIASRYNGFRLEHQQAADAVVILDARWQSDRATLLAKEDAARKYQAALASLAKANEHLAKHAGSLKAKDLFGLLGPYTAELESLAPAIQKAFL